VNNSRKKVSEDPAPAVMEIIRGERSMYGVLDSALYLPTHDSTKFEVKIYQGEDGLMLESPKILIGNLFGIKSTTGPLDLKKYSFTFVGKDGDNYLYGIPYSDFPFYGGTYYTMNLDYCWIYYRYDDMSNTVDMVEFSRPEFERLFDIVKAHMVN
jgi:hypothetical protein